MNPTHLIVYGRTALLTLSSAPMGSPRRKLRCPLFFPLSFGVPFNVPFALTCVVPLFGALLFLFLDRPCHALTIDTFDGGGAAISNISGVAASTVTSASSAIGGYRTLYAIKSGPGSGSSQLETFADPKSPGDTNYSLGYSQGSATGQGIVTWDGENQGATLSPAGLAGIDFRQDGGTAVRLGIRFFDFPFSHPVEIRIRLYDASNSLGLKYTDAILTLNQSVNLLDAYPLTIPFSAFESVVSTTIPGPDGTPIPLASSIGIAGSADLSRIGAIQLIINGLSNITGPDLILDFLDTNGRCGLVPNGSGRVTDECGVCFDAPAPLRGKDSCGVCLSGAPGYTYTPLFDECGLCPGSPNYSNAKDSCGICFGNNSSCLDCRGVPHGSAVVDICGTCAGSATALSQCSGGCTIVPATAAVRGFERRLLEKASILSRKFEADAQRAERNKCPIQVATAKSRFLRSFRTISTEGRKIFSAGVKVCGSSCVTVSYAAEVQSLTPQFRVLEKETLTMANLVKRCYAKLKIPSGGKNQASTASTIGSVQSGLRQLVNDCRRQKVCPH